MNTVSKFYWRLLYISLFFCCLGEVENPAKRGSKMNIRRLMEPSFEQSIETLSKLFDRIDTDSDGRLSKEEIHNWIMKANEELATEDARINIAKFDKNNDKEISWEEYKDGNYGKINLESSSSNPDHDDIVEMIKDEKIRFNIADKDHSGKLNFDEVKLFYHPHIYLDMVKWEVYKTLKDYDLNNNGKINRDEYTYTNYQTRNVNSRQRTAVNRIFKLYDADKDSGLDEVEIENWLKPDVIGFAEIEADHLLAISDINKDGQLTRNEVLDNFSHWERSKATNYGQHFTDEL